MEITLRPSPVTSKQHHNGRNPKRAKEQISLPVQKSTQDGFLSPEFINVTDTVSLDKSSKTKVRIQVMKDYHRRKVQEIEENKHETLDQRSEPPQLSAKAQTKKFRLGDERVLRPWEPKKGPSKKNKITRTAEGKKKILGTRSSPRSEEVTSNKILFLGKETIDTSFLEPQDEENESTDSIHKATEDWLTSLEYYLQTSMLHYSPSGGALDPFAAMSLLITPRTQHLLHHYCGPPLSPYFTNTANTTQSTSASPPPG